MMSFEMKKETKKDGSTVYKCNVYLGVDSLTGKKRRTTVRGATQKIVKQKAQQKINEFINNDNTTLRKKGNFESFAELTDSWFDVYKLGVKENTLEMMKSYLKSYILPAFGEYKPEKVSAPLIQTVVNDWASKANQALLPSGTRPKGSTKEYPLLLNIVSRILKYGISLGAVENNQALNVIVPRLKTQQIKKIKYFEKFELREFLNYLEHLDNDYNNIFSRTLYKLMLSTGLRVSEVLALVWSDIDFENSTLSVTKTMTRSGQVQDTPKTESSERLVALDNATVLMLKQWQNAQRVAFLKKGMADISVVFASATGGHRVRGNLSATLKQHFQNANVPNIKFHGFRHTHATILLDAGATPKEIQHRLGHKNINVTLNTYSHLMKDKSKETANIFEQAISNL